MQRIELDEKEIARRKKLSDSMKKLWANKQYREHIIKKQIELGYRGSVWKKQKTNISEK